MNLRMGYYAIAEERYLAKALNLDLTNPEDRSLGELEFSCTFEAFVAAIKDSLAVMWAQLSENRKPNENDALTVIGFGWIP